MLASITPLGERGRGSTWGVTVSAFLLGASAAGAALGAALGALGAAVLGAGSDPRLRLIALAVILLAALALDALPARVPGPSRQVNERWLDEFRGWVYGLGFGAQLGIGITTVVSSAATYAALAAALLSGSAGAGATILGVYGALRGLTPLAAGRVRAPEELIRLHAGLDRLRVPVRRWGLIALAVLPVLAVIGAAA